MSLPVASIIVPTYQGVERLPHLFDSLAAQEKGTPAFEVIVVVDGVDDGSVALIESENRFDVRSIVFPENRGRVAALNAGFREAKGNILIRCDDDLVVPRGYVRAHVAAHEGAVRRARNIAVIGKTWDVHVSSPYERAYGSDAARNSFEFASTRPAYQRWRLWAASCSISRDTWFRVGEYSPAYKGYGWEDIDYGYRIYCAGIPIVIAEAATAEHHGPARSTVARARKAFDSGKAKSTFLAEHPDGPLSVATPPAGLWGRTIAAFAVVMQRCGGVGPTPALVDAVLGWVPVAVGRKLVAVHVEAAGLAGERLGRKAHA